MVFEGTVRPWGWGTFLKSVDHFAFGQKCSADYPHPNSPVNHVERR